MAASFRRGKLGGNIINKLQHRETRGCLSKSRKSIPSRYFTKIPGRLCYFLRTLVPESILEDGHVFLGFTKNGQYVVSYTLTVDESEHTAFPIYIFKLYWWHFIPGCPLRKVSEVRLFGEEDILQDLYIKFCEWPEDDSKVLIYGNSVPGTDTSQYDICQCYFTVTAVPPLHPCEDCRLVRKESSDAKFCFRHGFILHSRYDMAPPFPSFNPRIQLQADGIVAFNTGDSIIAFSVHVNLRKSYKPGKHKLSSPDKLILGSKVRFQNGTIYCGKCITGIPINSGVNSECTCSRNGGQLTNAVASVSKCTSTKSIDVYELSSDTDSEDRCRDLQLHCRFDLNKSLPVSCDHCLGPLSPKSPRSKALCNNLHQVANENHKHLEREDKENVNHGISSPTKNCLCSCHQRSCSRQDIDSVSFGTYSISHSVPPLSPHSPKQSPSYSQQSVGSRTDFLRDNARACSQRSFFSPSNSTGTESTSRSNETAVVQLNDSQSVTFSCTEFGKPVEDDSPSVYLIEDDLAYHSVLPVDVRDSANTQLTSLKNSQHVTEKLIILQMTFDVEHYLEEVIRLHASWGPRYIAFTNYDLQLLNVCPDRGVVLAKVFALVRVRQESDDKKSRGQMKLYETSFCFQWNLVSGEYETLLIENLTEVNESELKRKTWEPGQKEGNILRRETYIPQNFHRSVHVLCNEAVFRGKSLTTLLAPHHFVAILLP